jgi:hypothetical protein
MISCHKEVAAKFGPCLVSDLTIFYQSFQTFYLSKYFPGFRIATADFLRTLPCINNVQARLYKIGLNLSSPIFKVIHSMLC